MTSLLSLSQHLDPTWQTHLKREFSKDYILKLQIFLEQEALAGKQIYPSEEQYFNALKITPFQQVKVVILGQDPYHGKDQAHGLCFSVPQGIKIPPSLVNIYKELKHDLQLNIPTHGCLEHWAKQGVLLLNSVLSVEQAMAASHQNRGWEIFTDHIINQLNQHAKHLVFILWGAYAHKKGQHIDRHKHLVIQAPHPSPLSAHRGFFGKQYFSKTNHYLQSMGHSPIDWQLPSLSQPTKQQPLNL
ncbi:MAG: uracil-DNA glycosylase [Mariprofundaceae bacterium]